MVFGLWVSSKVERESGIVGRMGLFRVRKRRVFGFAFVCLVKIARVSGLLVAKMAELVDMREFSSFNGRSPPGLQGCRFRVFIGDLMAV